MKKHASILLILLPITAAAADPSALAFREQKIAVRPLSLTEIAKPNPLGELNEAGAWFRSKSPPVAAAKKFVSNMPIISPTADIDPKMTKSPASSIDYKLKVKSPDVEPQN